MVTRLPEIIRNNQQSLLAEWTSELKSTLSRKLIKDAELEEHCTAFLAALERGVSSGQTGSIEDKAWGEIKEVLGSVSRTRAQAGFSPSETAIFVFSLKRPLFARISKELPPAEVAAEQWNATLLLDQLGLLTTEMYQPSREEFTDLTDRQRAEEQREQLLAREQAFRSQLEAADRRKDEFLAMLAHELRNPLSVVATGLHVLGEVGSREPPAVQTRIRVLRQVGVLTRLVDDLLDVSRITRGKVELRREPTLLQEVVENAISTSQPLIDDRRHQLVRELDATPLCVLADPTRLEQVISNLINNAAKYTEPGGHIQITLRREGEQAVLAVRDTGIGIEPEMLESIFELFAQLDHSAARPTSGLGVGLTLVKRLAEMHGGTVQARSEGLSRGSEFEVRLPLLEEKARALDPRHAAPPPGRKRLLLVEDNPDIGETLRDLLQLLGHRVDLAADGLRGVQLALATRPDVALVDIGLPGIDGYEVARRLRATDAGKQILLVALTGYGRPEDRERSLQAGFDAHLVKPVDPDDLNALLASLAGSRKAAGQA